MIQQSRPGNALNLQGLGELLEGNSKIVEDQSSKTTNDGEVQAMLNEPGAAELMALLRSNDVSLIWRNPWLRDRLFAIVDVIAGRFDPNNTRKSVFGVPAGIRKMLKGALGPDTKLKMADLTPLNVRMAVLAYLIGDVLSGDDIRLFVRTALGALADKSLDQATASNDDVETMAAALNGVAFEIAEAISDPEVRSEIISIAFGDLTRSLSTKAKDTHWLLFVAHTLLGGRASS
jgi:hypothetical protein